MIDQDPLPNHGHRATFDLPTLDLPRPIRATAMRDFLIGPTKELSVSAQPPNQVTGSPDSKGLESMESRTQKVVRWIEEHVGGRVVEIDPQATFSNLKH